MGEQQVRRLTLPVTEQGSGESRDITLGESTKLGDLMSFFAKLMGKRLEDYACFYYYGIEISPFDTPKLLGIQDREEIEAYERVAPAPSHPPKEKKKVSFNLSSNAVFHYKV